MKYNYKEVLSQHIKANRGEIEKRAMGLFENMYSYSGLTDTYVGVEINKDGEVYTIGPTANIAKTMACISGVAITVVKLPIGKRYIDVNLLDYINEQIENTIKELRAV